MNNLDFAAADCAVGLPSARAAHGLLSGHGGRTHDHQEKSDSLGQDRRACSGHQAEVDHSSGGCRDALDLVFAVQGT